MSDVSLNNFLPEVLPWVRDCPELVARAAVRNALIEFCNKSHWWLQAHPTLTVVSGLNHYELDPPTDCDIVTLADVRVNGRMLLAKSPDELDTMFGQDWRTTTGMPMYYTRVDPAEVTLVPCPQETISAGLTMNVIMRPARTAEYVSEELWRRWGEEIAWGARARLHEMPGQPFTDDAAALKYFSRFRGAISQAIAERTRGQTRGPISVRMPRIV